MSLLKTLLRLDTPSHLARGDAYVSTKEWGLARLEYEKALLAWEQDAGVSREEVARKLEAASEQLHARSLERAALAEEAGDLAEAQSFLEGARDTLPEGDPRRAGLDARIEEVALRQDERSLQEEIEALFADQGTVELVQQRRAWEFSLYGVNPHDVDFDDSEKYTTMEIIELAAAVKESPDDPNLLVDLGMALARSGFTRRAVTPLRRAQELAPGDREIPYALGNLYADEGDLDLAVTAFDRALTIDPKFALCYLYLARTYLKAEDDEEAARLLKLAVEHADEDSGIPEEARELLAEIAERESTERTSEYPESLEERIP